MDWGVVASSGDSWATARRKRNRRERRVDYSKPLSIRLEDVVGGTFRGIVVWGMLSEITSNT